MNRSIWTLALVLALAGCGERSIFGFADADASIVDASIDASRVDAGDGGRSDGGTDAGMNDGGDAGSVEDDGGLLDASLVDASLDASLTDASLDGSLTDAGLDGSLVDASVLDASLDASVLDASLDGGSDAAGMGPAPVLLGMSTDLSSAAAYVLIGKTGITNVTGSLISGGHLGVSPVAATAITGFALVLDPTGQFSISPSVVPPARVYAANYAVPTPSNLTAAISSLEGAYADAASRSGPDFLNLGSGNIGGRTLAPGLYTWASGVTIPSNVTIAGGSNDVWIFQMTGDLDVTASMRVLLSGGARAENIFWQVSGQATLHNGAHVEGIILSQTGITLQTRASLNGRALAQTLVALDDNAITAP